jgi:L-asparaginase II
MNDRIVNPVLVEVLRGGIVESAHRGAAAIVDFKGAVRSSWGDVDTPILPRSAVKALQALPLYESGAARAWRLGSRELALACASHNGEPGHVAAVRRWLARIGIEPHRPRRRPRWQRYSLTAASPRRRSSACSGAAPLSFSTTGARS